ncbi:solute carrier family 13 member 1 [Hypomesus transpacificus]|uniref:solute carrier family 13 member 1 n=1 Tax=Hypomesus transpacificus TaxID=137520 RepID=UPI001F07A242|nr:solute carrier family 13 member 1 [Hypomesus transpacificus]
MEAVKMVLKVTWRYRSLLIILLTPSLLLPLPLVIGTKVADCAFVLMLMAIYWLTEALPLSATAMLPALLFPLFGILKSNEVAKVYFKDFHLLLIGVICLATSIEKWGLHRRIALRLVTLVGVNPGWLMLGFMSGCAFLSMWVSNTSAVAMVMPIVEAVIQQILRSEEEADGRRSRAATGVSNLALQLDEIIGQKEKEDIMSSQVQDPEAQVYTIPDNEVPPRRTVIPQVPGRKQDNMICKALCISIAYSSSMGGIATLPGTSPNLIFSEYMTQFYPDCDQINFGNWLLLCVPISILMLLLSWIWLYWLFIGSDFRSLLRCGGQRSEREKETGRVIQEEYNSLGPIGPQEVVTLIIFVLMALLWFTRKPGFMPGWANLFPEHAGYATDATAALLLGLLLFVIPAHGPSPKNFEAMITWKEFQAVMPWEVALLVGGGFALAEGTQAEAIQVNPLYMLIPTTLCTSFSFLLPVSNPSNAIVFGYGHLRTIDMVKAGLGTNVIGVLVVVLAVTTLGVPLFGLNTYPDWAPILPPSNSTGLS